MKTALLLLFTAILINSSNAQNIVFQALNSDHSIGDNLPDTVEVIADSIDQVVIEFECFITNSESSAVTVKMTREIISYVSGANDQLCWGTCTLHTENDDMVEKQGINFDANETKFTGFDDETSYSGLGGVFHYLPMENSGTTIIKYTLTSEKNGKANVEDELIIKYTVNTTTSVINKISAVTLSNPYPNPAHNATRVKYSFNQPLDANLVVTNIIGSQVYVKPIYDKKGEAVIEVGDLPAGLYFINLISDGEIITNKKLIKR